MARKPARKGSRSRAVVPVAGAQARRFVASDEHRNAICAMVSVGTQHHIISRLLHIPLTTLRRHFAYELEFGRDLVFAKVGTSLAARALGEELVAKIFFAKARMGWRDRDPAQMQASAQTADALFTVSITG